MSGPWLSVIGIGEDGVEGLGRAAREILARAKVVVGGRRHLAMLPEDGRTRVAWRSPLADTMAAIAKHRGRPVAVLATGDPLWYGVGRLLLGAFPADEVRIVPQASAFQLACSRLGWPVEDVVATSTHGRPLAALRRHLRPGVRIVVLTSDGSGPSHVAALLREAGLGEARIHVLERLGGPSERIVAATADRIEGREFAELNTVAIEVPRSSAGTWLPCVTGLPDSVFEHDGQLTKAEVRAVTISRLAPNDGELLWDVGAGAGSIGVEWLRSGRRMRAIAVERQPERAARCRRNAEALGVPELEVVQGEAPACLATLPCPDAIFVGGAIARPGLLEACWSALRAGGRLVANAVTIRAEAALLAFHAERGGALTRLAVSRAEPVGELLAWRPLLPVTQLSVVKSCDAVS